MSPWNPTTSGLSLARNSANKLSTKKKPKIHNDHIPRRWLLKVSIRRWVSGVIFMPMNRNLGIGAGSGAEAGSSKTGFSATLMV